MNNKQITKKEFEDMQQFIEKFSSEKEIIPLFYVESGSRMWGFASKDSDFDIRGFHITSLDKELSFFPMTQQYEKLNEIEDVVSYDINKFFKLLSNSNPNILEQIQSKIVYKNRIEDFGVDFDVFKHTVFRYIDLKKLFYHYLSMAEKNYLKYRKEKFTYKKILYILRSLYCAKFIYEKNQVPPVEVKDLISLQSISVEEQNLMNDLLKIKEKSGEKKLIENSEEVAYLIKNLFEKLQSLEKEKTGDKKYLDKYLNECLLTIKYNLYFENSK